MQTNLRKVARLEAGSLVGRQRWVAARLDVDEIGHCTVPRAGSGTARTVSFAVTAHVDHELLGRWTDNVVQTAGERQADAIGHRLVESVERGADGLDEGVDLALGHGRVVRGIQRAGHYRVPPFMLESVRRRASDQMG